MPEPVYCTGVQYKGSGMARNPRYDLLFEPIRIGPVTAPNRFYQVPHASGMTNALPRVRAAFRETKAEGGWGVVCTGALLHPSELGRLAVALCHAVGRRRYPRPCADDGGRAPPWRAGRRRAVAWRRLGHEPHQPPAAAVALRHSAGWPTHVGFMGNLRPRPWTRPTSATFCAGRPKRRARRRAAGFDIVYVYAGMGYLPYEFLLAGIQPAQRRIWRLDREPRAASCGRLLEVTKEAVGDELRGGAAHQPRGAAAAGPAGTRPREAHEVVALLARAARSLGREDAIRSPTDCGASRFAAEGSHEPVIDFVKRMTEQAGGRRRPLHLARYDGLADPPRRARPDRRGAALDRRSVPAEQDRRGPRGRDPRMHRLQYLHLQLARRRAGSLHAESRPRARNGGAAGIPSASQPRAPMIVS